MSLKPCILPWINFGTNPYGRPRACGYSDQTIVKKNKTIKQKGIQEAWNNDYFKTIRKDFLEGKWPKNCNRCEYVEKLNGESKRIHENAFHYDNYSHIVEHTNSDGSLNTFPNWLDIRIGTTCNLKCIHCGTGCSSKWSEDKLLLDKYSNTTNYNIDNKWIEHESFIWDNIKENIDQVTKLNFLGGEPFANKQHNKFIEELSQTKYSEKIWLQYVTNGLLLNKNLLDCLNKFEQVVIRVSIDAPYKAGEFFRFPLNWNVYKSKLHLLDEYNFDKAVQWTCSNVSMFYILDTYNFIKDNFSTEMKFLFCNHVEEPLHMSAKVLPIQLKEKIYQNISNYNWGSEKENIMFYVNHMMDEDLWPTEGKVFMNYLNDLSSARNIDWRVNLKEMELNKYETN